MIYLTRTTVDLDGTRTTEIAALENGARLVDYEAQGFVACSYEVYREAWRAKSMRAPRPEAAIPCCPECASLRVGRRDGVRYCRKCKHEWSER